MSEPVPARVAIFGAGYVGLVTGACFAELGHEVVIRDVVASRIEQLDRGEVPIYEPGLKEVLDRNRERLSYTLDVAEAIDGADFVYIAVGTPATPSGDADLSAVWTVVDELPPRTEAIVVMKSTVPVGTGEKVRAALDARGLDAGYVSNPEFTAEGSAVRDFMEPDRIVIGCYDREHGEAVARLHTGIDAPILRMDVASAEMVKLASNAFLSTRISFINEIANVCERVGADVEHVAKGMGLDHRLGPHFLRAGIGFGGSCLAGTESVLVRGRGGTRLTTLARLFEETDAGEEVEILTWQPDGDGPAFLPIELLTRREYEGELVELRTKMGRRVRCTPDHLFVTQDGRKRADELTNEDWLPLAQGVPVPSGRPRRLLNVVAAFERAGLAPEQVIVRPQGDELAAVGLGELHAAVASHRRGPVARSHDVRRAGALRLHEAVDADVELESASFGTAKKGTYVPAVLDADGAFWRIVGLYLAEGHVSHERTSDRRRLFWSFHPWDEAALVEEVRGYWESKGVKATTRRTPTSTVVEVSSRLLASWWLDTLGLGSGCYDQRVPDLIWDQPQEHKRALLAGLWLSDGSWSYVCGGPSVLLEYGTVSRELADAVLRLLGELGVVARLKVGRTRKSTVDTYWLAVSGAEQVERLLDLFPAAEAEAIRTSIGRQGKRTRPTGYRREENAAWVRVVDAVRKPFRGFVYSLEVPPAHTFVTTGGLVTSNCFPKDVSALKQLAGNSGYHFQLLAAVIEVNELQKRRVVRKLQRHLGSLRGTTIALLGLAFKPNTDDMREAPSIVLAGRLLAEGATVRGWDPVADATDVLPGVEFCSSPLEAVRGADAAVIVTEWPELNAFPRQETRDAMRRPLIVDGRNMLDPAAAAEAGFVYEAIGRTGALGAQPESEDLLETR